MEPEQRQPPGIATVAHPRLAHRRRDPLRLALVTSRAVVIGLLVELTTRLCLTWVLRVSFDLSLELFTLPLRYFAALLTGRLVSQHGKAEQSLWFAVLAGCLESLSVSGLGFAMNQPPSTLGIVGGAIVGGLAAAYGGYLGRLSAGSVKTPLIDSRVMSGCLYMPAVGLGLHVLFYPGSIIGAVQNALGAAMFSTLGHAVRTFETAKKQVSRNLRAGKRVKEILDGAVLEKPIFLYARSFSLDAGHFVENPRYPPFHFHPRRFMEPLTQEFEDLLASAVEPLGELITLGRQGDAMGAGRVPATDKEWKDCFERLANAASLVLVVPAATSGARWEVEWLRDHLWLDRCLFLMPPEGRFSTRESWRTAEGAFAEDGYPLPRFHKDGLVFSLQASVQAGGTVVKKWPFKELPRAIEDTFKARATRVRD